MNNIKYIFFLAVLFLTFSSCETDDDPIPEQFETTFPIEQIENSGVFGEITFLKTDENSTLITVRLNGTQDGNVYPVRIHSTSPEQDGPVVRELNAINGATGISETIVTDLADGTSTTYEDWVGFDGYVLILESEENLDVQIAIGLLGDNIPNIPGG
ncbi:hypothetical protein [Anditalea andensis]|uniref:CHRD domain-containing protein n=1 Tax=Anditalea andensis TaxID=1048983 RepID=A0A074KVY5_9BACT|nr:hypothetical protein [Anditalea andensis]KEO72425.1 hypothetical protein EL17_16915 [Anditalea andensis]